ncbi:MAG: S41 family peptidase [Eubacteriales bacterium]
MMKNKKFLSGLFSGFLLTLLLLGSIYIGKQVYTIFRYKQVSNGAYSGSGVLDESTSEKLELIEKTIEAYYLEDVDTDTIIEGIFDGMVDALEDPYSTYYSVEELADIQEQTEGIYYGIGAYVSADTDTGLCRISGVIENTPAQEVGLRTDDLIYMVEDTMIQGMDTTDVTMLIKGEEGTYVNITIIREGEEDYLYFDIERRKIESPTVNYEMLESNIGYIQITEFDDVTEEQFTEALAVCKGSNMEGLILDLRSNPGGNLSTVCEIARKILPEGMIVYTEDKYGERSEYTCDGKNQLEVPIVVLINGYSASASEILAGAIKDYEMGTLMGTTTFGKGIVQRIITLTDGSALKLTVSKYYTPNGNNIHEIGIEPDIEIEFDAESYYIDGVDNQLEAAIAEMKEQMQE